jgi:hypothetical protein
MTSLLLCLAAFVVTYRTARRSLWAGIASVLTVGYGYGIYRANFLDGYSHLLFDAALVGLYAAQLFHRLAPDERLRIEELRLWLVALVAWPVVLVLAPTQDPLVELVGLRGNTFMLPCLLLGARLDRASVGRLALWIAGLNLAAGAVAAAQFVVGIEPFFPRNPVTDIIYRSGDVAGFTAYRIPSCFSSAHAYAGTMVATLPLLVGAWMQPGPRSRSLLLGASILVSVVGVFAAAARQPVVLLFALALTVVFSSRVRFVYKARWLLLGLLVAWIVSSEARFQRFTTLRDPDFLVERVAGSVNLAMIDLARAYPLGNGLGGGGTSIPYFLQDRVRNVVVLENEYARILLEQGIPGLLLWIGFIVWVFTRRTNPPNRPWFLARRMARVFCLGSFGTGLVGIGLLTSIPGTALFLLSIGWIAVREAPALEPAPIGARTAGAPAWRYGTS